MSTTKPWQNAEGYNDPTAYAAISSIQEAEAAEAEERCKQLIRELKATINKSGFDLLRRIELRDRKAGRHFL